MKYLHLFENESDFNAEYNGFDYIEPWVSLTKSAERIDYNNKTYNPYLHIPFTIEALSSGNISWALDDETIQCSKNNGSWETINSSTVIPVVAGDEIKFKGTITDYRNYHVSSTAQFNVKGNIMSLSDGDNFETADTVSSYRFCSLFSGCTNLISAGNLKLPVTTLDEFCYVAMFENCTNLTTVPELPATTLAFNCYSSMFHGCTSLTVAPELNTTTLARSCYSNMFQGCTSLTTAPELPATVMETYCYYSMFEGCTNLTVPPELHATVLAEGCYGHMFENCTSLTNAPELPATTLAYSCYTYMFKGCTNLTTAPELPATALTYECYKYMFNSCSNLSYIKAMFTTTPSSNNTGYWVTGVKATGTFVKNSAATWTTTGVHAVPSGWTIETSSE